MNDPEAKLKVSFDGEECILSWRRKEATTGQKALLFKWGLLPARPISRGEASIIIDPVLMKRRKWRRPRN